MERNLSAEETQSRNCSLQVTFSQPSAITANHLARECTVVMDTFKSQNVTADNRKLHSINLRRKGKKACLSKGVAMDTYY